MTHEVGLRGDGLRDDEQAAGVLVEPVHDPRTGDVRELRRVMQQRIGKRCVPVAAARMNDQTRRLVDHQQRVVLVNDDKVHRLRSDGRGPRVHQRDDSDKLAAAKSLLCIRGRARQGDAARIDPGFDTAARMLGHELRERLIETHAGGPLRNSQRSLLGPGRARAQVIIQSCHRRL